MSGVIVKKSSYDYAVLKSHVFEMMDAFGGDRITSNSRVLIKPNFLSPAKPETAVVTHPLLIRAAAEYVLEKDARPQVSDSPAMGSFERVLKESGTSDALKGLPVELKPFHSSVKINIGDPFGEIDIAEDALKADFVINLPKFKTHNLMLLTLGVKNLFGCVIGLKKPEWHFKIGNNLEMFSRLIVLIHNTIKPQMTLLDGILAMEGDGPGRGGSPKHAGLLIGSEDAFLLDRTVCYLLGIPPDRVPINRCAREMGYPKNVDREEKPAKILDFRMPGAGIPVTAGKIQDVARRLLISKPVADPTVCPECGACRDVCPASAIKIISRQVEFDYDKCIRCYCCTEVCPHGALHPQEPLLGKLFRKLLRGKL